MFNLHAVRHVGQKLNAMRELYASLSSETKCELRDQCDCVLLISKNVIIHSQKVFV